MSEWTTDEYGVTTLHATLNGHTVAVKVWGNDDSLTVVVDTDDKLATSVVLNGADWM